MTFEERAQAARLHISDALTTLIRALNEERANGIIAQFNIGETPQGTVEVTRLDILVRVPTLPVLTGGAA